MKKKSVRTTSSRPKVDGRTLYGFRKRVLSHWKKSGRHALPWRQTEDPYHVLVSEVMLQQTQVDRVIPKYNAFLKAFPSARTLARAALQDVLQHWSGLGYNRRAKMLHDAARIITDAYGGSVPVARRDLNELPGVGAYTADAVRVFAFDIPATLIETNIRTALLHHFFPRRRAVDDEILSPCVERLVSAVDSPRIWYWALMDYGAYIKQHYGNASRRSKHYTKQTPFEGSLRQVRGSLIRVLSVEARTTPQLVGALPYSLGRVEEALAGLVRDGLVKKDQAQWRIAS